MKFTVPSFSSLSIQDVLKVMGIAYAVIAVILSVLPVSGPLSLPPDIHTILITSLGAEVALFSMLHKLGYNVPDLQPIPTSTGTTSTPPSPKV